MTGRAQPAPRENHEGSYSGALESLKWRLLTMQDENGDYDPTDISLARAQRKANVEFAESNDGGGIGNYSWTERGPDNIGGRSRALLVHPTIPSRLYAGAVGGARRQKVPL